MHEDSVWTLITNSSFTKLYSGGRDKNVYYTDLQNSESTLICTENLPVISLLLQNEDSIWVTTTDPIVKNWGLEPFQKKKYRFLLLYLLHILLLLLEYLVHV